MGSVWFHSGLGLGCSCFVGERCSWFGEHCSFVDGRQELERERHADNCNWQLGLGWDGRQGRIGHHLGSLGCSIFHHRRHRRTGWMCHIDRRSCVEIESVDIVAEQVVELAEVVLVGLRGDGLR